jgi:tRNA threonylcarbamoyl adenosine modification protein YeaZ
MRLLALDTSLDACSVAVLDGAGEDARLTQASEVLGRGHAERLMVMIGEVMAEAGATFASLDRIVVTTGPGSFTGLRVGLSAARGIALVVGAPAVGVTTLAALAEAGRRSAAFDPARPVHAVIAAKGNEVYVQGFAGDGTPLDAPRVAEVSALAAALAEGDQLFGSGAASVATCAAQRGLVVLGDAGWPDICCVARLGRAAAAPEGPPEPLYLRPPDAKPAVRDTRLLA